MSHVGPSLRSLRLWNRRENMFLAILDRALMLLRNDRGLSESEIELNRELYKCLLEASRELYPHEDISPLLECNNQPDPDDVTRATREQKRPDFQWVFLDRYEADPKRSSKQFVVECKRLGSAIRPDWVFNANYVNHGIVRFRDPIWAYAKRFSSGAMVGYLQSMNTPQVLGEVHSVSQAASFPDLVLKGKWKPNGVSRLDHEFDRNFEASPFKLFHLWVDLRTNAKRKK